MTAPAPETDRRLVLAEWAVFMLLAGLVLALSAHQAGIDFAAGDLVDTDGYMRFVRIRHLLDTGDWFSSVIPGSNAPFGETLHWTRPLDVVVIALAAIVSPFVPGDALYIAAVANAPVLFAVAALVAGFGLRRYLPANSRHVLLPALLAAPVTVAYAIPGRLDHHMLLLLLFLVTLTNLLGVLHSPLSRSHVVALGISMAVGMWTSTEYLVPAGLVFLTGIGWWVVVGDRSTVRSVARVFAITTGATAAILLVERGGGWAVVEFDKISLPHLALMAAGWVVAGIAARWQVHAGPRARAGLALIGAVVSGAVVLAFFPDLAAGPFVAVDPVVAERWLQHVGELRSLADTRSLSSLAVVAAPLLLGGLATLVLSRRRLWTPPLAVVAAWWGAYTALTVYQVRWAVFGQILSVPLIVAALSPLYAGLARFRRGGELRAVVTAAILGVFFLVAALVDVPAADTATEASGAKECAPDQALAALSELPPTVVLADQDLSPEILYRTEHQVIATPYHRNSGGFHFLFDTMAAPPVQAERLLESRGVGLVLVCPGPQDLTYPPVVEGSFYQSLVEGPHPDFVRRLPTGGSGHLLFAVES